MFDSLFKDIPLTYRKHPAKVCTSFQIAKSLKKSSRISIQNKISNEPNDRICREIPIEVFD